MERYLEGVADYILLMKLNRQIFKNKVNLVDMGNNDVTEFELISNHLKGVSLRVKDKKLTMIISDDLCSNNYESKVMRLAIDFVMTAYLNNPKHTNMKVAAFIIFSKAAYIYLNKDLSEEDKEILLRAKCKCPLRYIPRPINYEDYKNIFANAMISVPVDPVIKLEELIINSKILDLNNSDRVTLRASISNIIQNRLLNKIEKLIYDNKIFIYNIAYNDPSQGIELELRSIHTDNISLKIIIDHREVKSDTKSVGIGYYRVELIVLPELFDSKTIYNTGSISQACDFITTARLADHSTNNTKVAAFIAFAEAIHLSNDPNLTKKKKKSLPQSTYDTTIIYLKPVLKFNEHKEKLIGK